MSSSAESWRVIVKPGENGRRRGAGDRLAFNVGGDGESEQREDRGSRVDEIGLQVPARSEARTGQGDDSLRSMSSGKIGVRLKP